MTIYLLTSDQPTNKDQIEAIQAKLKSLIPEIRKIAKIEDIAAEISGKAETKIIVIFVSPDLPESGDRQNYQRCKPLPSPSFLYFGQQRDFGSLITNA